ncbi:acetyl-CoA synthetase [Wolfiporia cocos MD-104 SS10]|uniref:Acetyl-CoA synthetase n=1 Tax=Wolfiporia cocos (strain MD-104) TaxID=742152 RepID=A0A2H3JLR8_WOLCO|nr:acetyl-CoA synthetase [Wolfiporia cocos MD-104 SS10]
MGLSDYVVTDDLTIILGLVAACLFLLHNLYRPQSLVHPILLGRQSDVARVRNPGESAVYRNYGTGMLGRFPVRPTKDQQVLLDLVRPDSDGSRTLWSTRITNPELRERVAAFGTGLIQSTNLAPQESNVLLLLNDSIEFLIADLALASYSIPSFVLTSLSVLSPVLDSHPPSVIIADAKLLPNLLEVIYDSNDSTHPTIVVVGDVDGKQVPHTQQVRLLEWIYIERRGAQGEKLPFATPNPQDVFTVSFSSTPLGELHGTQFTHENLTAGVAAARNLLPLSNNISPLDTIVSAFPLSTPYGRAVAYTAVYEGTSFATLESAKLFTGEGTTRLENLADLESARALPIPSPTILFVKPAHLAALTSAILEHARKASFLYSLAWRHKFAGVIEGFFTKESLWDRLVFDSARAQVLGKGAGTVRAVIVSGGPLEAQSLVPSRIALSVPLVNTHTHHAIAGPVFATHPLDLQAFPPSPAGSSASSSASDAYAFTYLAPVGPPAANVEAKLLGVDDAAIEDGGDPCGTLYVRGPTVGRPLSAEDGAGDEAERWLETGERAKVAPNGTFKVVSLIKSK